MNGVCVFMCAYVRACACAYVHMCMRLRSPGAGGPRASRRPRRASRLHASGAEGERAPAYSRPDDVRGSQPACVHMCMCVTCTCMHAETRPDDVRGSQPAPTSTRVHMHMCICVCVHVRACIVAHHNGGLFTHKHSHVYACTIACIRWRVRWRV